VPHQRGNVCPGRPSLKAEFKQLNRALCPEESTLVPTGNDAPVQICLSAASAIER